MVKAIAPNTPIEATRMTMLMTRNSVADSRSSEWASGRPSSPTATSPAPNRTAKISTCSTSPVAKAANALSGMRCTRKSIVEVLCGFTC